MVARRMSSGAVASTGFWATSGFCPRRVTTNRRMRRTTTFSDFTFLDIMETASVQDREKQKKRPLSEPLFSKRLSGGDQRELCLAPLRRTGTDRGRCGEWSFFKGGDLFSIMGMSICGTKMVNGTRVR